MKHPLLVDDGWKRRALPTSDADSESMSAADSGRPTGATLNKVFVFWVEFSSSTHSVTTDSFSAPIVEYVQYTMPWSFGTIAVTCTNVDNSLTQRFYNWWDETAILPSCDCRASNVSSQQSSHAVAWKLRGGRIAVAPSCNHSSLKYHFLSQK